MKINSFLIIVGLSIVSLNSCKKTYQCECTFKGYKTVHPLQKQTKKDATKECNNFNIAWQDSNGSCMLSK